jgi:hypothetical protein
VKLCVPFPFFSPSVITHLPPLQWLFPANDIDDARKLIWKDYERLSTVEVTPAQHLVDQLLKRVPEGRLGYNRFDPKLGAADVKKHPWLVIIDWHQISRRNCVVGSILLSRGFGRCQLLILPDAGSILATLD